jgi:hypothetical protein
MTIHKEVYSSQEEWQQLATNPILGMDNVLAAYAGKVWQITGYGVTGVSNYYPATDSWNIVPSSAPPFGQNYAARAASTALKFSCKGILPQPGSPACGATTWKPTSGR